MTTGGVNDAGFRPSDPLNKPVNWRLYFFFRILREDERLEKPLIDAFANAAADETEPGERLVRDWLGRSVKFSKPISVPIAGLPVPPVAGTFRNWLTHLMRGGVNPKGDEVAGKPVVPDLAGVALTRGSSEPLSQAEIDAVTPALPDVVGPDPEVVAVKQALGALLLHKDYRGAIALAVRLVRDNLDYGSSPKAPNWMLRHVFTAITEIVDDLASASAKPPFGGLATTDQIEFIAQMVTRFYEVFTREDARGILRALQADARGASPVETAGRRALAGGLFSVVLYELLRQIAQGTAAVPYKRAMVQDDPNILYRLFDLCFTHAGLEALDVDRDTLESFPDAFREGMAARAYRLGDIGENAPENWHGELGQRSIHGYFSGGFRVGDAWEDDWERLRRDIDAFNDPADARGRTLRTLLREFFHPLGIEILNVEVGQYPYEMDDVQTADGTLKLAKSVAEGQRKEHFGFRDGISQPYANMKLDSAPAGGGIPKLEGGWRSPAAGEIYLGQTDEDGNKARQPCNAKLRLNGTFKVFRKLEQDVAGFRNYLAAQFPESSAEQERLAAEMVGRWKDGRALTRAPSATDPDPGQQNDFRYLPADARGTMCPISAHVRRSNPRDIAGEAESRRHRIQRMGIAYGGALIGDDQKPDARPRGLLFVCANARIDMQFEVIQGRWINGGEFLGQSGLAKCPITGTNSEAGEDMFVRAGGTSRVTRLPRFVTMRGGDYFYAPGTEALRMIAGDCRFEADKEDFDHVFAGGHSMNRADVRELFDVERLQAYGLILNTGIAPAIKVAMPEVRAENRSESPGGPPMPAHKDMLANSLVFFSDHKAVQTILRGGTADGPKFNRAPYKVASHQITRGPTMLVGTDPSGAPDDPGERERMADILGTAWGKLNAHHNAKSGYGAVGCMQAVAAAEIERQLAIGVHLGNKIDLVGGLAARTVEKVMTEVFGTPPPFSMGKVPLGILYPRQPGPDGKVPELPKEWIPLGVRELMKNVGPATPENQGFVTMRAWSVVILLALVGNVKAQKNLYAFSYLAALEFKAHLTALWNNARATPDAEPSTLLQALVAAEPEMQAKWGGDYSSESYRDYVMALLIEMVGTAVAVIPRSFAAVLEVLLDNRVDLPNVVPVLKAAPPGGDQQKYGAAAGLSQLIYEAERLNPNFPVMMRQCSASGMLNGFPVNEGDWIAAFISAANTNQTATRMQPNRFSLAPWFEGEARNIDDYFLFGVPRPAEAAPGNLDGSCWGRDRLVLAMLYQLIDATARLDGLKRLAGPEGEVERLLQVPIGLKARFSGLRPR